MREFPGTGEALVELRMVCDEIDGIFHGLHSLKSLVRGLGTGADLSEHVTRLNILEERVQAAGQRFFVEAVQGSNNFRLKRSYWCEVMVATSALADWATKTQLELDQSIPYDSRERQLTLRLFLRSVKSARAVWKMLETDS